MSTIRHCNHDPLCICISRKIVEPTILSKATACLARCIHHWHCDKADWMFVPSPCRCSWSGSLLFVVIIHAGLHNCLTHHTLMLRRRIYCSANGQVASFKSLSVAMTCGLANPSQKPRHQRAWSSMPISDTATRATVPRLSALSDDNNKVSCHIYSSGHQGAWRSPDLGSCCQICTILLRP